MEQHLARDPQNVKMYSDIIIEQEKRVFTERVTDPETTVGTCHYLPHHALFKESANHHNTRLARLQLSTILRTP